MNYDINKGSIPFRGANILNFTIMRNYLVIAEKNGIKTDETFSSYKDAKQFAYIFIMQGATVTISEL